MRQRFLHPSKLLYLGPFLIRRNFLALFPNQAYRQRLTTCLRAGDLAYKLKAHYKGVYRLAGLDRKTGLPLTKDNLLEILKEPAVQVHAASFAQERWYFTILHHLMSILSNSELSPEEYLQAAARVLSAMFIMRMLAEMTEGRTFPGNTLTNQTLTDIVLVAVGAIFSVIRLREEGYVGTVSYDPSAGGTIWVEHVFGLARTLKGRGGHDRGLGGPGLSSPPLHAPAAGARYGQRGHHATAQRR